MTLNPKIKIAFASGTDPLNRRLIEHLRALYPDLPLWVVSNFPPEDPSLKWIRYRVNRTFAENLRRCREELRGHDIRLAGVMLVPNVPFRRMRLLALVLSPRAFVAFNENLNHFMLRPASLPAIARHIAWRAANLLRWTLRAARTADSAASHADWAPRGEIGKIASSPSPINFSTSPPNGWIAPTSRAQQSFNAPITCSHGSVWESVVKSRRSELHTTASINSPLPRRTDPLITRSAHRRPT